MKTSSGARTRFVSPDGMDLPPSVSLIVASLDLRMVRLIRDAIATDGIGPGDAGVEPAAPRSPDPEAAATYHPAPHFEPRPTHRPEPRVETPAVVRFEAVDETQCKDVPPAFGPPLAPWQAVLREKVWNRPVAAPVPSATGGSLDRVG